MEATKKKEDLLCEPCLLNFLKDKNVCKKHGARAVDWKCMYCCSVAEYKCLMSGWFCAKCHDNANLRGKDRASKTCKGGVNCPLGVAHHPLAGSDERKSAFPLGCRICRSLEYYAAEKNVERDERQMLVNQDED